MKKFLVVALVFAAVASAAFIFLKKATVHRTRAAQLVPANTIFFAQFPNWQRSAERWPQTALAQIWAEPEVQAFLAKPRSNAPQMKLWQEKMDQIRQVAPGEAFLAVTSIEGPQPKMIAGFSFSGKKADVGALLAEPHAEMKRNWPAGKSDLTTYGGTEIETFSHQDVTVAEAFKGDWYFVANDLELLHAALDASARDANPNSLDAQEIFKNATAPIPANGDALVFAQLGTLTDRLVSLLVASGQQADPKQLAELKKIQAITWGTKMEGVQCRDSTFLLSPGGNVEAPMPLNAGAFSAPETILYYATAIPATASLPESASALAAFVPGLQAMDHALGERGLKWNDFGQAFGPEFGALADWAADAAQPSALFVLDVRDGAKAKGFTDALTSGLAGSPAWGRTEEEGVALYQSPAQQGLLTVSPTMALTDRFLVIGLDPGAVSRAFERLKAGRSAIAQNGAYQAASKTVKPPSAGFGYLDLKALFERSYGTMRPFIAMALAFNPDAGRYIDASKLPGTEAISRHLGPSIYSQSVSAEGTLMESVGPLTFHQVLLAGLGGGLAAAMPTIENALSGGLKLDPNLLQIKPGGPPPAVPAAPKAPALGPTLPLPPPSAP